MGIKKFDEYFNPESKRITIGTMEDHEIESMKKNDKCLKWLKTGRISLDGNDIIVIEGDREVIDFFNTKL
jgi:hypothetical protein